MGLESSTFLFIRPSLARREGKCRLSQYLASQPKIVPAALTSQPNQVSKGWFYLADFMVCQVAQVFTKLGRKAQIYNRSLGRIALQSEKDNIVHLTNMIFVKDLAIRTI